MNYALPHDPLVGNASFAGVIRMGWSRKETVTMSGCNAQIKER